MNLLIFLLWSIPLFSAADVGSEVPDSWVLKPQVKIQITKMNYDDNLIEFCRIEKQRIGIEEQLKQNGLSPIFSIIPIIETRYTNKKGKTNAGLWNLERKTAELYRLKIGRDIDERNDEKKSTQAAIQYLLTLKELLNDNFLMVLAYYHGERDILTWIKDKKVTDPWMVEQELKSIRPYLTEFVATYFYFRSKSKACR